MMTCVQARLLLHYDGRPGAAPKGIPELGFHLAMCAECREIWNGKGKQCTSVEQVSSIQADHPKQPQRWRAETGGLRIVDPLPLQQSIVYTTQDDADSWPLITYSALHENDNTSNTFSVAQVQEREQPTTNEVQESGQAASYWQLLRNANFRALWLGEAASTFGTYFTRIAIPIFVFQLTRSVTMLGLAYFSSLISSLLFGLIAGALADRWDRRKIMISADVLNGLLLLVLMGSALAPLPDAVKLGSVYGVGFLAAIFRELFNPARVAIFADVLSEEELLLANSLDRATITFAEILSYPLAAIVLSLVSPAVAFGIDALTFIISALLIAQVSVQKSVEPVAHTGSLWAGIGEGLRFAFTIPVVRKITILSLIVPAVMSLHTTWLLPFALDELHSTETVGFPALAAVEVVGIFVGTVLVRRIRKHISHTLLLAYGILGYGLALAMHGLVPLFGSSAGLESSPTWLGPWSLLLLLTLPFAFLGGAANSLILASLRTLLQEQTPRGILGRVYSVTSVAAGCGFALGALLAGIGDGYVAIGMAVLGACVVCLGLICIVWLPRKKVLPALDLSGST